VKWAEYVTLAERLVAEHRDASQRCAVSCAYYGAFNVCRRWLEANDTAIDRHRAHGQVWGCFETAGLASTQTGDGSKLVADLGNSLRRRRNRADYDDSFPDLDQQAVKAVRTARQILALLPELELAD
jgi:hypothetical protein